VKRLLLLTVMSAFVVLVALGGSASADPNGGGCQLQGTANISPGLSNTAQDFSYSFTGDLTSCQSSSGGPASGTVMAGTNGLPVPTGNGSCVNSTTSGIAVAQWSDGTTTVVQYSTNGALAAVALQGSVVPFVASSDGTTYTTTRYAGNSAIATLAFEPPDPTACAGAGVTIAGIEGIVSLASR
jgi:hypothetical protein